MFDLIMESKTIKIIYWIATSIFALGMFVDGFIGTLRTEYAKDLILALGYPYYILTIVGVAKMLGAIGIVQAYSRVAKEWAFAGFAFIFLGASVSHIFNQDIILKIVSPLVFFILLAGVYWLNMLHEQTKSHTHSHTI